jgi:RNA polymerase sigma-70 factor (ECF subfamily)
VGGEESRELSREMRRAGGPDPEALWPIVYDNLRRMAARQMREERGDHTLDATALVHEAYLRLVGREPLEWRTKGHFYAAAAEAMRRILVDHARARGAQKRGGERRRVVVSLAELVQERDPDDLLAVDDALSRLEEMEPRAGSIARLRLFARLSVAETAEALGLPVRTVERDWSFARVWLYEALQ